MKKAISIILIAATFSSCGNSQSSNPEQAKQLQSAIKKNKPGTVATTANGYMMKAKLDGKNWEAGSMMPPQAAGRIIGYNNEEYIGLPYDKRYLVAGKKIVLGEDEAADIFLEDGCSYPLTKGQIEITKVDGGWAEGKFFFTTACSSTNKLVKVTDGFFRIPVEKNQ